MIVGSRLGWSRAGKGIEKELEAHRKNVGLISEKERFEWRKAEEKGKITPRYFT